MTPVSVPVPMSARDQAEDVLFNAWDDRFGLAANVVLMLNALEPFLVLALALEKIEEEGAVMSA